LYVLTVVYTYSCMYLQCIYLQCIYLQCMYLQLYVLTVYILTVVCTYSCTYLQLYVLTILYTYSFSAMNYFNNYFTILTRRDRELPLLGNHMIKIPVRIELNVEAGNTDQLWLLYNVFILINCQIFLV